MRPAAALIRHVRTNVPRSHGPGEQSDPGLGRGLPFEAQAILDAALDGVVVLDEAGRITNLNTAAELTLGHDRSGAVGARLADLLFPGNDDPSARDGLTGELAGGASPFLGRRSEVSARCGDGVRRRFELALSRFDAGAATGYVAFLRDVSARALSHDALAMRRRVADLSADLGLAMTRRGTPREVLQRCTDAIVRHLDAAFARIWTLDASGQVLELRASSGLYTDLDGAHSRVPLGQHKVGTIAATRTPQLTNAVIGDPLVSDQDWARREGMVSFAGCPLTIDDDLVGVLAMFAKRPMSELDLVSLQTAANGLAVLIARQRGAEALRRRALELARSAAALERSNRELSQFAYVTSHDLKAPLRGIANLAQWIEEDLGDDLPGGVREHLDLLRGRVHRMEKLIDGILEYSRVGRLDQRVEAVDAAALVREVVELLELPESTRVVAEPGLPRLTTARLPLFQVLMNLIANAARHGRRDAALVRVGARRVDGAVEFRVEDNGPGIPERFRERVWGVFQRLDARDAVEGTGIGLAIVKKVVEGMGGTVRIGDGEGDTPGARFEFTWPDAAEEEETSD